jgi:HAD superfamily hydrolase (TIGR01490 family)
MRIVFVDLDGTLIDRPSAEARFLRRLFLDGRLGPRQLLPAAAFFLRYGARFRRDTARKNKAYLNGLGVEAVAALARPFVSRELLPLLRPFMLAGLEAHRQAGDRLVLLTGAPDFLAAPLARAVGAADCIATRPDTAAGLFTARPPAQHPYGAEKLARALAFCAAAGARLDECAAYADTGEDLPLLSAVGRAVAVTPDAALAAEARRRGWEILRPEGAAGWPAGGWSVPD